MSRKLSRREERLLTKYPELRSVLVPDPAALEARASVPQSRGSGACIHLGPELSVPEARSLDAELIALGVKRPTCNGRSNVYRCGSEARGVEFTNKGICWGCKFREDGVSGPGDSGP